MSPCDPAALFEEVEEPPDVVLDGDELVGIDEAEDEELELVIGGKLSDVLEFPTAQNP